MSDTQVWQDREIRFDVPAAQLELRSGELLVDTIEDVEDTKGNNGEHGVMRVTNLRIIWVSAKYSKTNLSIGYNCVMSITVRVANSRLRGTTQALFVLTKFNNTRFEFVFTNLVPNSPRLFTTIQAVQHAYESSRLYRDLKLRGAIIHDKQLILQPEEQIYSKVEGVWNLSSDQGNLGSFYVTNVRLVWFANLAENFNVSIPYIQMKTIKVRDSKFGVALVIETLPSSGGYMLGFKIDPVEQLKAVAREIHNIHQVYSQNPIFGVTINNPFKSMPLGFGKGVLEEGDNVTAADELSPDGLSLYYAETSKQMDREPVFAPELGLAIEALKEGATIQSLWQVT